MRQLIEERRISKDTHQDMLGGLMKSDENKHQLDDAEIVDQIITILYSGYETVSTTSMMAIKYLHDHPRALQELRVSLPNICTSKKKTISSFYLLFLDSMIYSDFFFFSERTFGNQRKEKSRGSDRMERP